MRRSLQVFRGDINMATDHAVPNASRRYGVYSALVSDVKDPDGRGRVRVRLHSALDDDRVRNEVWARLVAMMSSSIRGDRLFPAVDDEVLVAFEAGDARRPYVIGTLWNGKDRPSDAGSRTELRSRNGIKVTLDDEDGQERLVLETPGGQKITLKDGPGAVEIVDSNGNSVKLETAGITVTAAAKVTVNASQVAVSAGMVTIDAGMSRFSGVVQADTVIANNVISASYTPGAGNIW
jgi:uncharacterized protein involved in type VI secretion and phage assembly